MTKSKSTMNLTSPRRRSAEAFVEAAGEGIAEPISPVPSDKAGAEKAVPPEYPWQDPKVREDVIKAVNLRLPEPYLLKLQYIADITNKSQQAIIREALLPAIDDYIEQMEKS